MKIFTICLLVLFYSMGFSVKNGFSQTVIHEEPVIADRVPNIPEELFENGKLSKYVALSLPDNNRWNPDAINLNANATVFAIGQGNNDYASCFVGGHFDGIGGVPASRIAFFDDRGSKTFSDVGGGVQGGDVYTILRVQTNEIYVGGNFKRAGNIAANCIAHWDGTTWETYGLGTDSTILAMALVANTLYVGGNFHHAGGLTANYIATLDLTTKMWSPIIDGIINGMNGGVAAIILARDGNLYVGGGFTKAGIVPANKIAYFDGSKWFSLQSGIDGINAAVSAIAQSSNTLSDVIAGGNFQTAGGFSARNIASWDGKNWQSLGDQFTKGFDGPVYAIAAPGSLFIGGDFRNAGDSAANNIAKLQADFQPLGSGLDGPCYALSGRFIFESSQLSNFSNHLYVGGAFMNAGLKLSQNFAIWGELSGGVHETLSLADQISLRISPNPIQSSGAISFILPRRMNIALSLIDPLGRIVVSLRSGWREAGAQEVRFDTKNLPAGAYYCRFQAEGQSVAASFVVIR